jgi:hypothetical protein
MKRALGLTTAAVLIASLSFGAGYWYRTLHPAMQGLMEDYALANVLEEVGYAHSLEKGNLTGLRDLIDTNLSGHLSRVAYYQGSITDDMFVESKIRTLNAAANLWEARPPFAGLEKENSNQPWWPKWQEMNTKNRELLQWAKGQCMQKPELKCALPTQTPQPTPKGTAKRVP